MLLSPPVEIPPPPALALFFMLISGFPIYGPGQYPTAQQHIEWVILTPRDYTDPPPPSRPYLMVLCIVVGPCWARHGHQINTGLTEGGG